MNKRKKLERKRVWFDWPVRGQPPKRDAGADLSFSETMPEEKTTCLLLTKVLRDDRHAEYWGRWVRGSDLNQWVQWSYEETPAMHLYNNRRRTQLLSSIRGAVAALCVLCVCARKGALWLFRFPGNFAQFNSCSLLKATTDPSPLIKWIVWTGIPSLRRYSADLTQPVYSVWNSASKITTRRHVHTIPYKQTRPLRQKG